MHQDDFKVTGALLLPGNLPPGDLPGEGRLPVEFALGQAGRILLDPFHDALDR
jgi:hypothetical protein